MHPKFEVLMASIKHGESETFVLDAAELPAYFDSLDWTQTALINHNALFDASILWWRYGKRPAMLIDTMSMAQAAGVVSIKGSASLANCTKVLQEAGYVLPPKGDAVMNALGKRRADFTPQQWAAYKEYCKTDSDLTWLLFKVLRQYLPDNEMVYQDMILRCYTEPMLEVDAPTVAYELHRTREYKRTQLAEACRRLGLDPEHLSATLRSNDQFAALLYELGGVTDADIEAGKYGTFVIPTKVSPTTGKTTWAFGKTDVEFKELCEHDDPLVQAVCQARLAAKSSIDETRCETFLKYAGHGFLPMGYKISGAHTHRLSGGSAGSANMQNLPSGRGKGQSDLLRRSIKARDGYAVVNFDSSQIEARCLAYAANQDDVLAVFASGGDIYSFTAAKVYGVPYEEINQGRNSKDSETAAKYKPMRQYGKIVALALGYGQGAAGFQKYALLTAGITLTMPEALNTVTTWRDTNPYIIKFWSECNRALACMANGGQMYFGGRDGKLFFVDGNRHIFGQRVAGIRLPDGMWINYPNIRTVQDGRRTQYVYDRYGYNGKPVETKTYSGKIAENLIQGFAFAVMKQQALWINRYFPVKMNTHDEWSVVVPRDQAETAAEYMARCMTTAPEWAQGLPLGSEGGWAQSYGAVDDDWSERPDNPDRKHYPPTS